MKKPFVTLEQLQEMVKTYPTPFHLYDEEGTPGKCPCPAPGLCWNPGYTEYFAVKATPNPQILKILKEEAAAWTAPPSLS
mgnify:CR=1 FL=1